MNSVFLFFFRKLRVQIARFNHWEESNTPPCLKQKKRTERRRYMCMEYVYGWIYIEKMKLYLANSVRVSMYGCLSLFRHTKKFVSNHMCALVSVCEGEMTTTLKWVLCCALSFDYNWLCDCGCVHVDGIISPVCVFGTFDSFFFA